MGTEYLPVPTCGTSLKRPEVFTLHTQGSMVQEFRFHISTFHNVWDEILGSVSWGTAYNSHPTLYLTNPELDNFPCPLSARHDCLMGNRTAQNFTACPSIPGTSEFVRASLGSRLLTTFLSSWTKEIFPQPHKGCLGGTLHDFGLLNHPKEAKAWVENLTLTYSQFQEMKCRLGVSS